MPTVDTGWATLPAPWWQCLTLAWEARVAGSVPVGAVVVDGAAVPVVSGRNRCAETGPAGPNRLSGTNLAHAEINALSALAGGNPPAGPLTLFSTLEPCLLCTAAALHCHVPAVRFAAADPLWAGIEQVPSLNSTWAHRWPERERCELGPFSVWAAALPARWSFDHSPAGATAAAYRRLAPRLTQIAGRLQLAGHTHLEEALDANWPLLVNR